MTKTIALVTWCLLTGCSTIQVHGVTAEETCPSSPLRPAPQVAISSPFRATLFPGLASTGAEIIPFSSPPPTVSDLSNISVPRTRDGVPSLLGSSPALAEIYADVRVPPTSAEAGVELWKVLQQISVDSYSAEKDLRASANMQSGPVRRKIAEFSTKEDIGRRVVDSLQKGGDDALLRAAIHNAVRTSEEWRASTLKSEQLRMAAEKAERELVALIFLKIYFKAYFRGGRIFETELKTDQLTAEAVKSVKSEVTLTKDQEDKLTTLLKARFEGICKSSGDSGCILFGGLGKESLVTRSGETIQFKGISLALGWESKFQTNWEYPKSAEFAPQVVRVLIEALFDARESGRVPAVSTSTVCAKSLYAGAFCFKGDDPRKEKLTDVDEKASRADSLASMATGQLIRGASIAALNNEALARSIENAAGATARKVVERVVWARVEAPQCPTPMAGAGTYIEVSR